MGYNSITYIGKESEFNVKIGNQIYEFEWMKGLGVGRREGEVNEQTAEKIAKWRDKKGRKIFRLE